MLDLERGLVVTVLTTSVNRETDTAWIFDVFLGEGYIDRCSLFSVLFGYAALSSAKYVMIQITDRE